jgi:hypothetical protein
MLASKPKACPGVCILFFSGLLQRLLKEQCTSTIHFRCTHCVSVHCHALDQSARMRAGSSHCPPELSMVNAISPSCGKCSCSPGIALPSKKVQPWSQSHLLQVTTWPVISFARPTSLTHSGTFQKLTRCMQFPQEGILHIQDKMSLNKACNMVSAS